MKLSTKEFWKELIKGLPLFLLPLYIFLKVDFIIGILCLISISYIGKLYDLKWQVRLKELEELED